MSNNDQLKELQKIPGVGKSIAQNLIDIGINTIDELKDKKPDQLYGELCVFQNTQVDRCMLYVFRCAVYFAEEDIHDPEKLKWWNWKD